MSLSDSIVSAESGGDPNAQNPNSSAVGAGQFIAPTWLSVIKEHRPDLAQGRSDDDLLAMRSDPDLSRQMVDAYAADNGQILAKNGFPVTPGTQYLAHFAGPQGAVSVLQADSNTPVSSILGQNVVKANPFLAQMSAGDLIAWAGRKMGITPSAAPGPAQPAGAPANPASPAIAGILNQGAPAAQGPGILNQGPDFQNQLAQLMAARETPQVPSMQLQAPQPLRVAQAPPISVAMPKGLSRARLLAALSSPLGG
ncbi:MAG TPA: hypothetical protein VEU47_10930 [Candidatus Cybelea sp.]|nr:hypothetical protein [Candidatus Cybelea sp.]